MDEEMEQRIRDLAQPLWDSAAKPYGLAMEFWLMAEKMVLEAARAFNRMQVAGLPRPPSPFVPGEVPPMMPVDRVRALAECMWEAAGRQYGVAQDYWLAAERHVQAMLRAATAPAPNPFAREVAQLPPWEYLERIREAAYFSWQAAGQQYGDAIDYWVRAEQQILDQLRRAATPAPEVIIADMPIPPDAVAAEGAPAADAIDLPAGVSEAPTADVIDAPAAPPVAAETPGTPAEPTTTESAPVAAPSDTARPKARRAPNPRPGTPRPRRPS